MHSKASQIAGMKMICSRNYKIPLDLIDWESVVDGSLTYCENWAYVRQILLRLLRFSPLRFRLMESI